MKKAFKIAGFAVLGLIILLLAAVAAMEFLRPTTPAFKDRHGRVIPGSVASLEKVKLGGLDQWVLIRGRSTANPVVLFLHGGPGMPDMYLAHSFQRPLEDNFVMVQWDQRGAGKSYSPDIPPGSMKMANLIADTCELAGVLRERFHQDKIYLVGHSFGSYLGMLVVSRRPELFKAFVGVGQDVEYERSRRLQDEFIRENARARGDNRLLAEFEARGDELRESLIFRYGGELFGRKNMWPLLVAGFLSPEYKFSDALKIPRGVAFTHENIDYRCKDRPLLDAVTSVDIPVYFFMGRHDYTTPAAMAEVYYERIQAPLKRLVWFERSAHFPFFEEPLKFAKEMIRMRDETEGR